MQRLNSQFYGLKDTLITRYDEKMTMADFSFSYPVLVIKHAKVNDSHLKKTNL
jgi:hypothetical protein